MMGIFKGKSSAPNGSAEYWRSFIPEGVAFGRSEAALPKGGVGAKPLDNPAVGGFLAQMEDDGRLTDMAAGKVIPWSDVYDLLDGADRYACRDLLSLPHDAEHVPALLSIDSLRDRSFGIVVRAWRRPGSGGTSEAQTCGALIVDGDDIGILPRAKWELLDQVSRFQNRPDGEHDEGSHRRHWGWIRRTAVAAGAQLDEFLFNTVVLTPEKLHIGLRKDETGGPRSSKSNRRSTGRPMAGSPLSTTTAPSSDFTISRRLGASSKSRSRRTSKPSLKT